MQSNKYCFLIISCLSSGEKRILAKADSFDPKRQCSHVYTPAEQGKGDELDTFVSIYSECYPPKDIEHHNRALRDILLDPSIEAINKFFQNLTLTSAVKSILINPDAKQSIYNISETKHLFSFSARFYLAMIKIEDFSIFVNTVSKSLEDSYNAYVRHCALKSIDHPSRALFVMRVLMYKFQELHREERLAEWSLK